MHRILLPAAFCSLVLATYAGAEAFKPASEFNRSDRSAGAWQSAPKANGTERFAGLKERGLTQTVLDAIEDRRARMILSAADFSVQPAGDLTYVAELKAQDLKLPKSLRRDVENVGLPGTIEFADAQSTVILRSSLSQLPGRAVSLDPEMIDLHRLTVKWGDLTAQLSGKLTVSKDGAASGKMILVIADWDRALDLISKNVPEGFEPMLRGLSLLARNNILKTEIEVEENAIKVLGLPLATLPPLRIEGEKRTAFR